MKFTQTAIRRPVTVSMFVVAITLFGLVSVDRLALNLLPDISYPSLTIQTEFEDAAPEEIESLVTRLIEETVGVVPGLRRLSSVSRSGQSEVVLEFAWDTDMDLASMDVREKLDLVRLPRDVEKPVILRFDPSYDPIMRLQLFGDLSLGRLRDVAERQVKKSLESTAGVAAVKVVGGKEEQIRIEIDEKRLAELGIPITNVANVVEQANLNQASGSLYDLDSNYLVRVLNEFKSVDEIKNLIVRDEEGRQVVLGEVARVWRGSKEREVIARFNGKECVELGIYKEGDANTVTVSNAIRVRLKNLTGDKTFPDGIEHSIVFDQAEFIDQSVNNVLVAAVLGGLLSTLILFLFLRDLRSTLIIGFSIPISIMATFTLMYQTGITLNIMSLGGIALGVGMLVDNSIVVLESVHRHRGKGTPADAVFRGTVEVGRAVTASTLTTVAVFVPLVFVEGIAGQLFKDQALTITYSLLASLAVALTFIPMVLAFRVSHSRTAASDKPTGETAQRRGPLPGSLTGRAVSIGRNLFRFIAVDLITVTLTDLRSLLGLLGRFLLHLVSPILNLFDRAFGGLQSTYPKLLHWSLDHKPLVFGLVAVMVVCSIGVSDFLGAELIPPLSQGEFSFEIRLPKGRPLEVTNRVIRDLETRVATLAGIETVFSSVGGSNKNQFSSTALEENVGQLRVVMSDRRDRVAERTIILRIREELDRYPEITHSFKRPTLFSFRTPIEVEIFAYDLEEQRRVAALVSERLKGIAGLNDIESSTELGNPEIQIRFKRQELARMGLDETQIAATLRNKIRGEVASRYREGDRQFDILVQAAETDRNTVDAIKDLVINGWIATNSPPRLDGSEDQVATSNGSSSSASGNGQERQADSNSATDRSQQQSADGRQIPIRLGAVAEILRSRGPSEIRRIGSQRAAVVSANLAGQDLSGVSLKIQQELAKLRDRIQPNTVVALGGQNEELETSYRSLVFALALAVLLVYLVMASQFESLIHPFIILFSVPLAMIGVVLALLATGTTISVMVFLGVIILAGIVVNNAIVLIDYTNQLRRQGRAKREALLEAGQVRLRPILMTTMTTVLGLFPMALGWGEGSEVRAPMAVAVMGGLLFSTALTLLLIPVIYDLFDRRVQLR